MPPLAARKGVRPATFVICGRVCKNSLSLVALSHLVHRYGDRDLEGFMMRTSQWLAVPGTACVAACYTSGVVAVSPPPSDSSPAQLPAETSRAASPSGLTLTCEVFCSQTKARPGTPVCVGRWLRRIALKAASSAWRQRNSRWSFQCLARSSKRNWSRPCQSPRRSGVLSRQSLRASPPLFARIRFGCFKSSAQRIVSADAAGEMTVVIEDLEPGIELLLARRDRGAEWTARLRSRHLPGAYLPG